VFFQIFWAAYVPIAIVILYVVGEWLKAAFRRLRVHERVAFVRSGRSSFIAGPERLK
jgi:hypothetical protein